MEEAMIVTEKELESMDDIELNSISNVNDDKEYLKSKCSAFYLQVTAIIVMLLGLLVFVFNIITIIMSTGSLNAVSVGEGILGGLVYIVISLIVLYDISQKTPSGRIIICNILLLINSFSLSIVSGCQAAMLQISISRLVKADQEINRVIIQLGVLCAKVVANLMVFFISVSHLVVCTKLFMDMATQAFSEMQKMKIHPTVMSGQVNIPAK